MFRVRTNHLFYDTDLRLDDENEMSVQKVSECISEILGYFNFNFHSGLAGGKLANKSRWIFPFVDIFKL